MDLTFKDPFFLQNIFKLAERDMPDAVLVFDKDGIKSQTMDASHVSLMFMNLCSIEAFKSYDYTHTEPTLRVGFSLINFLRVSKQIYKDSVVGLTLNVDNLDVMTFTVKSDKNSFQYDLKLMDIDNEELTVPPPGEHFTMTFDTATISDFFRKIDGDTINIGVSVEDPLSLIYKVSGDIGTMFGKLTGGIALGGTEETPFEIRMTLSVKYLQSYCTVKPGQCEYITFQFERNAPLKIIYKVCGKFVKRDGVVSRVIDDKSELVFYISPRIENDE
jgi:hypothetical protein